MTGDQQFLVRMAVIIVIGVVGLAAIIGVSATVQAQVNRTHPLECTKP